MQLEEWRKKQVLLISEEEFNTALEVWGPERLRDIVEKIGRKRDRTAPGHRETRAGRPPRYDSVKARPAGGRR
jgi:hypothetical protein